MEHHNWYLMEEYNQCFKELTIFQVDREAGEAEDLGAAVEMVPGFAVISPGRPLNLVSLTLYPFLEGINFPEM